MNTGLIENFDSAATTPVDERVLKHMIPYFADKFGNASSVYSLGRKSDSAVSIAKDQLALALSCQSSEIFFTSGGTESNNWVLRSFPYVHKTLVVSATEHPSIKKTAEILAHEGKITLFVLPVDVNGIIQLSTLEQLLTNNKIDLVTVHYVNNETGAVQPIESVAKLCKKHGVSLHTDASQAFGKIPLSFTADYMTVSSHKAYGPKGIGALVIKASAPKLMPLLTGGGQQESMRAGTLNVPLIVGFGKSCEYLQEGIVTTEDFRQEINKVRSTLKSYGMCVNSDTSCVPAFLNFSTPCDSATVIAMLEAEHGIAVSKGAACMEGSSYVLKAMGRSDRECANSVRISLSKFNRKDKLSSLPHIIQKCVVKVLKEN